MVQIEKLIQGIRQESRVAQYFAIGTFVRGCIANIATRWQGHTTTQNNISPAWWMMFLGFLALAHSRLLGRIAQVAEALADVRESATLK